MLIRALSVIVGIVFGIIVLLEPVVNAPQAFAKSHSHASSQNLRSLSGIKEHVVKLYGEHKGCSISVRYPQFSGGARPAMRKLNREIKHLIDRNVSMTPAPSGQQKYVYSSDYKIQLLSHELISISFEFTNDFGGAHPASVLVPLNAQIFPAFKILKLTDVLNKNVDYKLLDRLLRDDLKSKSVATADLPGNFPRETFSKFTFDQSAFKFRMLQGVLPDALEGTTGSITHLQLNKQISKKSPIRMYVLKLQ